MATATTEKFPQQDVELTSAPESTDQKAETERQIAISLQLERSDSAAHLGKTLKGLNK